MSSLIGRTPAESHKELLTINNANGLTSSLTIISDGKGTPTPLALSTTDMSIHGNIFPTNAPATGAVLRMSTTTNQLEWASLTTSDITEGGNQYFTLARARAALTGNGYISVDANTGVISYTGSSGSVTSVSGASPIISSGGPTPQISIPAATSGNDGYMTATQAAIVSNLAGTNTGDQTTIVGITGTKAQFNTAVTDGDFLFSGDVTQYTDEMTQDAIGAMVDGTLVYTDSAPTLSRAALTGEATASVGSNVITLTNSAVISKVLTGYTSGAGTITSTDTLLQAIQKLNGNDATTLSAAQSYADSLITGVLSLKTGVDASSNPNYPSAVKGDAYYVTVAGKIGGASGVIVDVGDMYVASSNNAGGTQAAVGANWFILEHNLVGALLTANNLSDLTNVTTARTNLGLGTLATQNGTFSGTSSGSNTGDQTITLTGDISGTGVGSIVAALATVNASPQTNTFRKLTVNGKGLITATSAVASGDIIAALGFTPYNATNPSGYTSNSGTVTSASIVTANGISGSVATATTTPAITLTLDAITPTSVVATGATTSFNLSGTLDVPILSYCPGTVSVSGTSVTGTGVEFTKSFAVGQLISTTTTNGLETKAITSISETSMNTQAFVGTNTGATYTNASTGSQWAFMPNGQVRIAGTNPGSQSNTAIDVIYKADTLTFVGSSIYRLFHDRTTIIATANNATVQTITANPQISVQGGSFGTVRGAMFSPTVLSSSSGNISALIGSASSPSVSGGSGTITNMTGCMVAPTNTSSTITITNLVGGNFTTTAGVGTVGTSAGIIVGPKAVVATNSTIALLGTTTIPAGNFGIYNVSTADNYIAGKLGIGAVPSAGYQLDVTSAGDTISRFKASGQTNGLEIGQLTADGSSKIFAVNNNYLTFGTNNIERLRITATGDLIVSGQTRSLSKEKRSISNVTAITLTARRTYLTGTAGVSFTITLPAASASIDGALYTVMSTFDRPTTTWISSGATFVGTPGNLTANTPVTVQYHHATTEWFITA